ncbi:MAG TPA: hypothetical protein VF605_18655 [Allosphingosinicella sp.]
MTGMGVRAMHDSAPLGEGERRERGARRTRFGVKAGLFAVGLFTGIYVGGNFVGSGFDFSAPWSPLAAAAIALVYLAAMGIGSLLLSRHIDELERDRGYKAAAAAGAAYVLVYPAWFALWKGGFVPEPVHWLLFLLFWLSLALATLWYRFR